MKSFRYLLASLLIVTIAGVQAADKTDSKKTDKKSTAKATPKATPDAKPDASGLPDPVAEMNGKPIKKAELEKEFNAVLVAQQIPVEKLTPEDKLEGYHEVLTNMINERLVRAKASGEKVKDDEVTKEIQKIKDRFKTPEELTKALKEAGKTLDILKADIRSEMQVRQWLQSQIDAKAGTVSEEEAKKFYDGNPDKFASPESIRVSHILIMTQDVKPEEIPDKEKLAKSIKDRIAKGEDFAKLATDLSEDKQSGEKGGDLGFITRKTRFEPSFLEAAFKLKVGEVSDLVKSPYGFHIIKVTEKKDAGQMSFEDVKADLIKALGQQKKQELAAALLVSLRKEANVKIYLPPLPQPGTAPAGADLPPDASAPAPAPAPAPGADAPASAPMP